ncbi:hypothetical protein [Maribacter hydrothermalis]|uniref:Lipocalin-like domain-containing protein n=1 Tax=Maribacter hydrothermalis TaxID=1836467 RepID=A0A1B7ZED5_9FLAO|nr:hypothetical protein [Maribacter hydrothermalis]APQ17422.1 hypothetical protein BTR34_08840 [Maribacter hydrothermalis]OBR41901.1 hypothetical protein A9200_00485 [Maribacter hydrothermalis]
MKYVLSCLVLLVLVTSCSKIEQNNDPIVGIWKHTVKTATNLNKMVVDNEEWIFNDVFLGRFHGYKSGKVVYQTDFKWSVNGNIYIVSYPGTDFPDDFVKIKETDEGTVLMRIEGKVFAEKQ